MRMCTDHWAKLRSAISDRGLDQFISSSGSEIVDRMAKSLEPTSDPKSTFDPLMAANNLIFRNALDAAGLAIMNPNDDGTERCPLCYLIDTCQCPNARTEKCSFMQWITFAADGAARAAIEMGLIVSS